MFDVDLHMDTLHGPFMVYPMVLPNHTVSVQFTAIISNL